jgi:hypothetical protein
MGKFNYSTKTNVSVPQSVILHSIAVEISNQLLLPIWEQLNMTEEEYNAIYVYNVETIEQEIINRIDNEIDVLTEESQIQIINHEDTLTRETLSNSETIADEANGISVGSIIQQIELIISSRSSS